MRFSQIILSDNDLESSLKLAFDETHLNFAFNFLLLPSKNTAF